MIDDRDMLMLIFCDALVSQNVCWKCHIFGRKRARKGKLEKVIIKAASKA